MDNNFYEYRRESRPRKSTEKPKNIMTKIIVVQLVLSLLISGILFAVCRTDSNLSQNIKSFYSTISKTDMTASQILDVFKKVAQFTFAPTTQWDGTFTPDETTTNGDETTKEPDEEASLPSGETTNDTTGENAVFSPVYLTVTFQNPIESNKITSKFGYRISPITQKYSLHTGLDIAAPEGEDIVAAYDGVVEIADYNDINGNYIVLSHGNALKTTYNHCSKLLVREGERVKKGEKIALVGATGWATGNHLHFEVLLNGKYINPMWVLSYEF